MLLDWLDCAYRNKITCCVLANAILSYLSCGEKVFWFICENLTCLDYLLTTVSFGITCFSSYALYVKKTCTSYWLYSLVKYSRLIRNQLLLLPCRFCTAQAWAGALMEAPSMPVTQMEPSGSLRSLDSATRSKLWICFDSLILGNGCGIFSFSFRLFEGIISAQVLRLNLLFVSVASVMRSWVLRNRIWFAPCFGFCLNFPESCNRWCYRMHSTRWYWCAHDFDCLFCAEFFSSWIRIGFLLVCCVGSSIFLPCV